MSDQHLVEVNPAHVEDADLNISVARLRAIMERVGCNASPEEFLQSVSLAYRNAQRTLGILDPAFEVLTSHEVFREGLREASRRLNETARILVLGCGADFVGCDATYAEGVVRDVIPREKVGMVRVWNLTRSDVRATLPSHQVSRYDLIISNSLLHFIAEIRDVLRLVAGLLGQHGMHLMAHEPNSRFWFNRTLGEERRQMAVDTTPTWRQRALRWSSYQLKLRKLLRVAPPVTLGVLVNRSLAEQYGLRGQVADHEIARIVDPHRPCEAGDGLQIGLNGFDVKQLSQFWNRNSAPVWMRSYDHLGFIDYPGLPKKWKDRDRDLAKLYPDDGSSWAALWVAGEPA